jgi:DNA primase
VAGRIRDEDIALVRERSPIADVVGEHVALRNAGGGNLKGICPFHEEKSPSLSVSPARGLFYCFGCGAGGDVIRFVERIDHLSFAEAVEALAQRAGVQLRYVEGGAAPVQNQGVRARLIAAHRLAAEFYAERLRSPEALPARAFLADRGFDAEMAERYGCGFAPSSWDELTKYLLGKGYSLSELTTGGLSRPSARGGHIDRFHRRLLWPIRDVGGDVVGFGARRLFDDDRNDAKYLNTPETPIYKKSQLLYGMDMAKKDIARRHQAVVVEGYTDVMACHAAGVTTAVATCGTAFGAEHVAVLRRLLMDSDTFRGEVVFTFDGDAAGMKAAERAFADDQKFVTQTYVAVDQTGRDPCEVRLESGDAAVRDLVASRVSLVEFMLRTITGRYDLDSVDGQVAALDATVPLVAQIKDEAARVEYAQRLTRLIGLDDPDKVLARVRARRGTGRPDGSAIASRRIVGEVDATVAETEREVLKVALQLPGVAGPEFDAIDSAVFLVPVYRSVREAIAKVGGVSGAAGGAAWIATVQEVAADDNVRSAVGGLAVEPLRLGGTPVERYAEAVLSKLQELAVGRQVAALKSRAQRMNPTEDPKQYNALFAELLAAEQHQRALRERSIGGL